MLLQSCVCSLSLFLLSGSMSCLLSVSVIVACFIYHTIILDCAVINIKKV